jgi:hypothetical protein
MWPLLPRYVVLQSFRVSLYLPAPNYDLKNYLSTPEVYSLSIQNIGLFIKCAIQYFIADTILGSINVQYVQ